MYTNKYQSFSNTMRTKAPGNLSCKEVNFFKDMSEKSQIFQIVKTVVNKRTDLQQL
jgi:hypothetical protein